MNGAGEDFEYRISPDESSAMRCRGCGLVYLNPRPAFFEFERIYPPNYYAVEFSEKEFGYLVLYFGGFIRLLYN